MALEPFEFLGINRDSIANPKGLTTLTDLISQSKATHKNLASIEIATSLYLACRSDAGPTISQSAHYTKSSSISSSSPGEVEEKQVEGVDEEERDLPPRLSIPWYHKKSSAARSKVLIVNSDFVVTFQDHFLLHVEVPESIADGGAGGPGYSLRRVDLYPTAQQIANHGSITAFHSALADGLLHAHMIERKAARRGSADAGPGEFSVAEIDPSLSKVFEMR